MEKLVDNEMRFVPEKCHAAVIPLRKSFKMFLELPGIFYKIVNYVDSLKKERYVVSNIMQAKTWLDKYADKYRDIVLPFYFLFLENSGMGLMHDFLEGTLAYVMHAITKFYIFKKKYFTLMYLNSKVAELKIDCSGFNKPPQISLQRLQENCVLKMSASESLTFTYLYSVMVGDKILDKDDEHWLMYRKLRKILNILMSPRIIESDATYLEKLIDKHHKLYIKLVGTLTAKFHNLVHYPRLLLKYGPPVNYWEMRNEANNKRVKAHTTAPSGSVN